MRPAVAQIPVRIGSDVSIEPRLEAFLLGRIQQSPDLLVRSFDFLMHARSQALPRFVHDALVTDQDLVDRGCLVIVELQHFAAPTATCSLAALKSLMTS